MKQLTHELAAYVVRARPEDLPPEVRDAARRSLINYLGVTIGAGPGEVIEGMVKGLHALGTSGNVPLLGRSETLDAMSAALVNGTGSQVLDFDSTQLKKTNIHPSGPVVPALLALAANRPLDGEAFLNAFVLGVEISCRIANSVFGTGRNPGWHVTGAAGGIGAAVAVGKVLGLDAGQLVAAIGIAANQSGGMREMYGSMCKALVPGRAAANGLLAAMLAQQGFSGPALPLEGKKGLARLYSGADLPESILDGLGTDYEITFNIYKPYPSAIVTHATIDGAAQLAVAHDLQAGDVARLELRVPPIALELAGVRQPVTELQCKFSLPHCAAVGIRRRGARVPDFSEEAAADPALQRLREATTLIPQEGLRKEEAVVTVVTRGGATHACHVEHALGTLARPMTDADIAAKFRDLTVPVMGQERAERLLALCMNLPDDVGDLARV